MGAAAAAVSGSAPEVANRENRSIAPHPRLGGSERLGVDFREQVFESPVPAIFAFDQRARLAQPVAHGCTGGLQRERRGQGKAGRANRQHLRGHQRGLARVGVGGQWPYRVGGHPSEAG